MLDKFALNVGDIPYDWQTLQPEMVFPELGDCLVGHVASTRLSSSTWMTPLRLCGPLSFIISFTWGGWSWGGKAVPVYRNSIGSKNISMDPLHNVSLFHFHCCILFSYEYTVANLSRVTICTL